MLFCVWLSAFFVNPVLGFVFFVLVSSSVSIEVHVITVLQLPASGAQLNLLRYIELLSWVENTCHFYRKLVIL